MIPLNQSYIYKKNKITNKYKIEEICENNFLNMISKLISFFLLLMIIKELLKIKKITKNRNKYPISIYNSNSTLENQYFTRFNNIFTTYKKENKLGNEYKNKFKQYLLDMFSSLFKKKYKKIDIIIFNKRMNFGNAIFTINNFIYFCEFLGCKNIYLYKDYWFVKKPIYDKETNITISPLTIDIWDNKTTVYIPQNLRFPKILKLFNNIFIPVRTYILKNEIFSHLKLINTRSEDLYINIRSGNDIFKKNGYIQDTYFQPPLCFYQTIISMFNFNNIYIISNGIENPVINKLLKIYNNIKYFHGTVEEDVAIILSAKNLVLPCSSFSVELIKISDELKNLFEFNLISKKDRNYWHFLDRHLKPLKFNRFIMDPSEKYLEIMKVWRGNKDQLSQMINEKCIKKFRIIPSDFI